MSIIFLGFFIAYALLLAIYPVIFYYSYRASHKGTERGGTDEEIFA